METIFLKLVIMDTQMYNLPHTGAIPVEQKYT